MEVVVNPALGRYTDQIVWDDKTFGREPVKLTRKQWAEASKLTTTRGGIEHQLLVPVGDEGSEEGSDEAPEHERSHDEWLEHQMKS